MKSIALLVATLLVMASALPASAAEARWGWSQIQSGWTEAWADLSGESWIVAEHDVDGANVG
jgi:hypothetical protein